LVPFTNVLNNIKIACSSNLIDLATVTGRIMVEAVEYPAGLSPVQYCRFSLWGDNLTILSGSVPAGPDCNIYYGQVHTVDDQSSTIPVAYEELVAGGASGHAAAAWALYTINRVNNGGEKTPNALTAWGKEKLLMFRAELKRQGRRAKVRVNRLYTTYAPPLSQSTDPGP
jgi:hypothetical protein